jgi:hypothetical protein
MKYFLISFLICITSTLAWAHPAIRILPAGTNIAEYNARNNTAFTQRNAMSQNTMSSASNHHSLQNLSSPQTLVFQNNRLIDAAKLNTVAGMLEVKPPSTYLNEFNKNSSSPISKFPSLVLPQAYKSNTQGLIFVKAVPLPASPFAE